MIENLLSRITKIEEHFDSRPGDVVELNRRNELIRYVIGTLTHLLLSYFQQAQGYRRATAGFTAEAESTANR